MLDHLPAESVCQRQIQRQIEHRAVACEVFVDLGCGGVETRTRPQDSRADPACQIGQYRVEVLAGVGHSDQAGGRRRQQQLTDRCVDGAVRDVEDVGVLRVVFQAQVQTLQV